jgi:hypothetical protein
MKNIPFRYIYKEFNMFFLENYKVKKIKEINFFFDNYLQKKKNIEKIFFFLKNIYVNIKVFKMKKSNNKNFIFKKFFRDFLDLQKNLV